MQIMRAITLTVAVCGISKKITVAWKGGGCCTGIDHGGGAGPLCGPSIG